MWTDSTEKQVNTNNFFKYFNNNAITNLNLRENSSILSFCYAFYVYTKSLLIFEENALKQASKILEETQKTLSNAYKKLSSKSQSKVALKQNIFQTGQKLLY